jgi:hypothetical protein
MEDGHLARPASKPNCISILNFPGNKSETSAYWVVP